MVLVVFPLSGQCQQLEFFILAGKGINATTAGPLDMKAG